LLNAGDDTGLLGESGVVPREMLGPSCKRFQPALHCAVRV
jgi:hypothetical protein